MLPEDRKRGQIIQAAGQGVRPRPGTLIHEMIRRDVHRGVAALCLGGGNSVALAVER